MSISEQITRITNEVTSQESLIEQIVAALESKAAPAPGTDTSDATATAGDILSGKTAYVNGEKLTGTYVPPTPEEITFKIKGTSYTAEADMTWEEWVNSDYNTGGCFIYNDNYIMAPPGVIGYLTYSNHDPMYPNPVYKTWYIWDNYDFTYIASGGSND